MRSIKLSYIAICSIAVLQFCNCNYGDTNHSSISNEEIVIIEDASKRSLAEFNEMDPNYKSLEYQKSLALFNVSVWIKESDKRKSINDSLSKFIEILKYSGVSIDKSAFTNQQNDLLKYKVAVYTNIGISCLLKRYKFGFFIFKFGKPLVVPREQIINLGEDFYADFYFACANSNSAEIVISNDTIKNVEGSYIPVYKCTPTERGQHRVIGDFIIKQPMKGVRKYDFSFEYFVK